MTASSSRRDDARRSTAPRARTGGIRVGGWDPRDTSKRGASAARGGRPQTQPIAAPNPLRSSSRNSHARAPSPNDSTTRTLPLADDARRARRTGGTSVGRRRSPRARRRDWRSGSTRRHRRRRRHHRQYFGPKWNSIGWVRSPAGPETSMRQPPTDLVFLVAPSLGRSIRVVRAVI